MNVKFAKTLITAATLAAALAGGVAQAASVQDNTSAGDKYGYSYRTGKFDTFTEGDAAPAGETCVGEPFQHRFRIISRGYNSDLISSSNFSFVPMPMCFEQILPSREMSTVTGIPQSGPYSSCMSSCPRPCSTA